MNRKEDIEFLTEFRDAIDKYLFLGYAPSEDTIHNGNAVAEMAEALEKEEFRQLRRTINEMKPRAQQLLTECKLAAVLVQYPPPAIGGPVVQLNLFDLVTENRAYENLQKHTFLDRIDQAIGVLNSGLELDPPETVITAQAAVAITGRTLETKWDIISAMFGVSNIAENTYRLSRSQTWQDRDYPDRVQLFLQRVYKASPDIARRLLKYVIEDDLKIKPEELSKFPDLLKFVSGQEAILDKTKKEMMDLFYAPSLATLKTGTGIFISYNSQDKDFARRLSRDLQQRGVGVWIDDVEIQVGDSILQKIQEGINEMDYLAVVLSPSSVNSSWVQKELEIALNQEIDGKKVKVLPVLYKDCEIPEFIKPKKYADFRNEEHYEQSLGELLARVGSGLKPL